MKNGIYKKITFVSSYLIMFGIVTGVFIGCESNPKDNNRTTQVDNMIFYQDKDITVYSDYFDKEQGRKRVRIPEDMDTQLGIKSISGLSETGDRILNIEFDRDIEAKHESIYLEYSLSFSFENPSKAESLLDNESTFLTKALVSNYKASAYLPKEENLYNDSFYKKGNNIFIDNAINEHCSGYTSKDSLQSCFQSFVAKKKEAYYKTIYQGDKPIYYRWIFIDEKKNKAHYGNIYRAILPRPLIFANVGDSFGSGEGAGAQITTNNKVTYNKTKIGNEEIQLGWVGDASYHGKTCHRANASAQERFMRDEIRKLYPHHAYDYINVACSGATLRNISEVTQSGKQNDTQIGLVSQWMNDNNYNKIDFMLFSGGGNDVKFSELIQRYLGIKFTNTKFLNPLAGVVGTLFIPEIYPSYFHSSMPYGDRRFSFASLALFYYHVSAYPTLEYSKQNFEDHLKVLKKHFKKTAKSINETMNLNEILVFEYPNILSDCRSGYHEDIKLKDFYRDYRLVQEYFSLISGTPRLLLDISKREYTDIKNNVAGFAKDGKGLNYEIKELVEQIDNSTNNQKWTYAYNFESSKSGRKGICQQLYNYKSSSYRRFNILYDAVSLSDHRMDDRDTANAYHPNIHGHNDIYLPNIRKSILNSDNTALKDNYLRKSYENENLSNLPDLIVDGRSSIINLKRVYEVNDILQPLVI